MNCTIEVHFKPTNFLNFIVLMQPFNTRNCVVLPTADTIYTPIRYIWTGQGKLFWKLGGSFCITERCISHDVRWHITSDSPHRCYAMVFWYFTCQIHNPVTNQPKAKLLETVPFLTPCRGMPWIFLAPRKVRKPLYISN